MRIGKNMFEFVVIILSATIVVFYQLPPTGQAISVPGEGIVQPEKCSRPCTFDGGAGIFDINENCIRIKDFYDKKYCCFDKDCAANGKCVEGKCKIEPKPDDIVVLYEDKDYEGEVRVYSSYNSDLGNDDFHDRASSVKVKDDHLTTLYQHENYGGGCRTLLFDVADLKDIDFNDKASSIRVWEKFEGVILYEHDNYGGNSEYFNKRDESLGDNCIQHDKVSSIKIAPGYEAILYEDGNFEGGSITITSDIQDLENIFGDKVSSIEVYPI